MFNSLKPHECFDALRRVATQRDAVYEELQQDGARHGCSLDRDAVKRMVLSIGYGASLRTACPFEPPPFLVQLKDELQELAHVRAAENPALFERVRGMKRFADPKKDPR
eukprot:11516017-Alexandrium_andersonii.AAC.1